MSQQDLTPAQERVQLSIVAATQRATELSAAVYIRLDARTGWAEHWAQNAIPAKTTLAFLTELAFLNALLHRDDNVVDLFATLGRQRAGLGFSSDDHRVLYSIIVEVLAEEFFETFDAQLYAGWHALIADALIVLRTE